MNEVRGRPFQPGNTFGRGRPKGSRNKSTSKAKKLLQRYEELIMQTAIKKGVHEDSGLLRVLVNALISDQVVNVGKPGLKTLDDVAKASEFIAGQVTCGKMTTEQGLAVGQVLEGHRKILETRDIKEHLEALEDSELEQS